MGLIDRSAIQAPVLPTETVEVPAIGGAVEVRAMLLGARLALVDAARQVAEAGGDMRPVMLARTVFAGDGEPVFSVEQWEVFAAGHLPEVDRLFAIALRLNGGGVEAEKKS